MVDLGTLAIFVWVGCFLVVAVDSVMRGVSPVFWRLAALVGGLFALLAYGLVREQGSKRQKRRHKDWAILASPGEI